MALAKGMQIKNWILGEKLGSGACSDVYVGKEIVCVYGVYLVDSSLTVFSVVYPANTTGSADESYAMKISPLSSGNAASSKKKRKKTPAERNADALYAEHLLYLNSINGHRGIPSLPPTGAYGEDQGYRYLVIQRLGRTLEDVRRSVGGIPEKTAARLGLDIVSSRRYYYCLVHHELISF